MAIRLHRHLAGLVAVLLLLSGCGGIGFDATGSANPNPSTPGPTAALRLAPGDKIRVTVFGEDRLSGEYQIDNSGSVSIPLAGTIEAAGLTKSELEQALTKQLKTEYIRNPRVTVDVVSFRPFYMLGEVARPGEYPFRSGLTVLSAIAIAGGPTYRASNSKVLIQRAGTMEMVEYPQSASVLIMPGDVLRVPERFF